MGNCQAAEAATVLIQHPAGNKTQRIYWSVSAHEIMNSNPGHYVALVSTSPTVRTENGAPLKQLKLLRPDDTLLIGQVYRLVSFEDVLKEFATKKCVKLGKLLKESRGTGVEMKKESSRLNQNQNSNPFSDSENCTSVEVDWELHRIGSSVVGTSGSGRRGSMKHFGGGGQWKPALQSISEIGI